MLCLAWINGCFTADGGSTPQQGYQREKKKPCPNDRVFFLFFFVHVRSDEILEIALPILNAVQPAD